jgi:hypothetical protein
MTGGHHLGDVCLACAAQGDACLARTAQEDDRLVCAAHLPVRAAHSCGLSSPYSALDRYEWEKMK